LEVAFILPISWKISRTVLLSQCESSQAQSPVWIHS